MATESRPAGRPRFRARRRLWAANPKEPGGAYLDHKAFVKPELYISNSHERLDAVLSGLPNRVAWEAFQRAREQAGEDRAETFIDPRSGAATNLIGPFPLLPGRGRGNSVTLEEVSQRLGRPIGRVNAATVGDVVRAFVNEQRGVLAIDDSQLGRERVSEITPGYWQVSIPQTYKGIPVRHGRLAATLKHGNLLAIGAETWGDVRGLSTTPKLDGAQAMAAGYAYAGGASAMDTILRQPALEIIPVAANGRPLGAGYRHRLVWTFVFQRLPEDAAWEVIVDAHDGEVLASRTSTSTSTSRSPVASTR